MRPGSPEILRRHGLVGHRPDHVRARDEHVRRVLHHEDEVGERGRVDRAAGARSHHCRDLRDDAGRQRVAQEDLGVAGERDDPFLDPRSARVVEADDRRARLRREIHDLADFSGVRLRQRAAEHREVLREDERRSTVDPTRSGHDPVPGNPLVLHVEVVTLVDDELVHLHEGPGVQQELEPLARSLLAGLVLAASALLAPGQLGLCVAAAQFVEAILVRHQGPSFIDFHLIIHQ